MHSAQQTENRTGADSPAQDFDIRESDFAAGQAFLLAAKNFWTTTFYRELRDKYDRKVDESLAPEEAVRDLEGDVSYHYFAWFERHLQRMKYTGRFGLVPYHRERRDLLTRQAGFSVQDEYSPVVGSDFELPKYYKSMDIHQHQGGLWSDMSSGFAYELGARTTTILLGDTHEDLHTRFTDLILEEGSFEHVLDLGCGFGKSTRPFVRSLPKASIEAVDFSVSCLYVASELARTNLTRNVRYLQQDARKTSFASGSFDLVTSTMVLHEMPPKSVLALFEECYRLLGPGGHMAHLDFYVLPDAFAHFMHFGHAKRNNEIYMRGLAAMDLPTELKKIGFLDVRIEQFKESEDVNLQEHDAWRFPWTSIRALKP
jgi:ubiquinone/menaquinone biosynthesis C-methylase UbiE